MREPLEVRGVRIGEGIPKIIVPIVEETPDAIVQAAQSLSEGAHTFVEWRADYCKEIGDPAAVKALLPRVREALGEKGLLFTFRTKPEGGVQEFSKESYIALCKAVAKSGCADLMDIEFVSGDEVVRELIGVLHEAGVKAVVSSHDFQGTPQWAEMVSRMRYMQDLGADIVKLAVMAHSHADMLELLSATQEMVSRYAQCPVITMSMGVYGVVSRMAGEVFGSAMTFGSVGKSSAPGQIPAKQLAEALQILHDSIGNAALHAADRRTVCNARA